LLAEAGAQVDEETHIVRIPEQKLLALEWFHTSSFTITMQPLKYGRCCPVRPRYRVCDLIPKHWRDPKQRI
jgi:hypothetical protein